MNCFGLFWFFHYIFSFFFTVLVVHPHNDHPVTTVLTHYSPMAWYSLFVLKVPLNTNQPSQGNGMKRSTLGSGGRFGGLVEASFSILLGLVGFLV